MDVKAIVDRINEIRRERRLTYELISIASGVPRPTVSRILRGKTQNPTSQNLYAIAKAVGYQIDTQQLEPDTLAAEPLTEPPAELPADDMAYLLLVNQNKSAERRNRDQQCMYNALLAQKHRWLVCSITTIAILATLVTGLTIAVVILLLR